MTLAVLEYPLHAGEQEVEIPTGASSLCIGEKNNALVLFAVVDPSAAHVFRHLSVIQPHWDVQGTTRSLVGCLVDHAGQPWLVFEILT